MFEGPSRPIDALDRTLIVASNVRRPAGDDEIRIEIFEALGNSASITLTSFCADLLIAQIIKAKYGPGCTAKI